MTAPPPAVRPALSLLPPGPRQACVITSLDEVMWLFNIRGSPAGDHQPTHPVTDPMTNQAAIPVEHHTPP